MLENLRNNDDEFAAGFLSYSLVKGKGKEEEEPAGGDEEEEDPRRRLR